MQRPLPDSTQQSKDANMHDPEGNQQASGRRFPSSILLGLCDRASWQILIIKPTRCINFSNLFWMKRCMFRTVPLSIIRGFPLYTQDQDIPSCFCSQVVYKLTWHVSLLCVQGKTPDDGQRNCPKPVEFCYKNKFEKLVHLVGFIIRIPSSCCSWL